MNGRGGFGVSHVFLRRCEKKNRMKRVERRPHDQTDRTKDPSARIFPPLQKPGTPPPGQGRPRRLSQIFGPAREPDPPSLPPGIGGEGGAGGEGPLAPSPRRRPVPRPFPSSEAQTFPPPRLPMETPGAGSLPGGRAEADARGFGRSEAETRRRTSRGSTAGRYFSPSR